MVRTSKDPLELLSPAARLRITEAHREAEFAMHGHLRDGGTEASAKYERLKSVLLVMAREYLVVGIRGGELRGIIREELEGAANISLELPSADVWWLQGEIDHALTKLEPNSPSEQAMRAAARRQWMEERHPGWASTRWAAHAGPSYKTIEKYRKGWMTRQTPSIRNDLAVAEKVEFKTVPE